MWRLFVTRLRDAVRHHSAAGAFVCGPRRHCAAGRPPLFLSCAEARTKGTSDRAFVVVRTERKGTRDTKLGAPRARMRGGALPVGPETGESDARAYLR